MEPLNVTGHATMSSAMKDAHNYHRYLCSLILPHLGRRVLEIGPGYGQYTEAFVNESREVYALDIDAKCVAHLQRALPQVKAVEGNLDSDECLESFQDIRFDTVIALNVLEHIADDVAALKRLNSVTIAGGELLLLVPAHIRLYGQMDRLAGHYRRYNKQMLGKVLREAGFRVVEMKYINPVGGMGWYLNSKFYKPASLSTQAVNSQILFFDKYVLPLSRLLTPVFEGFFGQSLWCRAIK